MHIQIVNSSKYYLTKHIMACRHMVISLQWRKKKICQSIKSFTMDRITEARNGEEFTFRDNFKDEDSINASPSYSFNSYWQAGALGVASVFLGLGLIGLLVSICLAIARQRRSEHRLSLSEPGGGSGNSYRYTLPRAFPLYDSIDITDVKKTKIVSIMDSS